MNSYELSRAFIDWAFDNPEKVKPTHYAIYFFAIEHCNRLGWKKKFGLPSQMVMEAIGVKNWRTYSQGLKDLVDFGFIEMVETSKNQYSSNIIAIVKNTKAPTKALDKALSKHSQKQGTKHSQGTVSIDKQLNKEQGTIKQVYSVGSSNEQPPTDKKKRSIFKPPELGEVREYCKFRKNNVDPQRFIDHYESNGWMVGKNKMKSWHAAVRTWEKNTINNGTAKKSVSQDRIDALKNW